jgi:hypothetical protein
MPVRTQTYELAFTPPLSSTTAAAAAAAAAAATPTFTTPAARLLTLVSHSRAALLRVLTCSREENGPGSARYVPPPELLALQRAGAVPGSSAVWSEFECVQDLKHYAEHVALGAHVDVRLGAVALQALGSRVAGGCGGGSSEGGSEGSQLWNEAVVQEGSRNWGAVWCAGVVDGEWRDVALRRYLHVLPLGLPEECSVGGEWVSTSDIRLAPLGVFTLSPSVDRV